jgi:manganese/zinc/iron transport system permease protein
MNSFWQFLISPWTSFPEAYGMIVLMGFLVNLSCAWIGMFLVLRRLSLLGDALSHSLLPGVVLVFLLGAGTSTWMLFGGALLSAFTALISISLLQRFFPIRQDAAMGIVFSIWFACGILLLSAYASSTDLDLDCVLFGELLSIGFLPPMEGAIGFGILPFELVRIAMVTLALLLFILLFYKELVISSFSPELATLAGLRPSLVQALLLGFLTLILVSSLESVGVILPVGMLIFPAATALLISKRIPVLLICVSLVALFSSVAGFYLSLALNSATAPCMLLVNALLFVVVWLTRQTHKRLLRNSRSLQHS